MQIARRVLLVLGAFAFALGLVASASAAPSTVPKGLGFSNATAVWWNNPPGSEAGWGINFTHQGNTIFATWFTYDSNRSPQWFIALLEKTGDRVYAGAVSKVTGPPFNSVPFPGGTQVETEVGSATVTFAADGQSATFDYTVETIHQTKTIIPQVFAEPVPTCTWAETQNLNAATNFQGLWWVGGGAEAGWGINFTHQGNVIFATWFTYDAAGKPWWLIVLLDKTGDKAYAGPVSTVIGPPFNSVPWDEAFETIIGNATLTFTDGNHATLSYTVSGVQQTKQLARQVFAGGGTVCSYTDSSQGYVADLVDIAARAKSGAITAAEFADELNALLASIDGIDGAVDQLKVYLEANVVGHGITVAASAASGNRTLQKGLMVSTFDQIKASQTFKLLEAAVAATTFLANPDPQGNFINAPNPGTLLALSQVDVRARILDAQVRGTITPTTANELLGLNNNNAYEALRQLYLQLAITIPAWLLPAPVTCVTNCVDQQRNYSGNGTGQADLQVNTPVSCHVIVQFTGSFTVDLTIHPNNTVNGNVGVNGTAQVIQVIQGPPPPLPASLCQQSLPINTAAAITGTIDNMTATLNIAGYQGTLIAHLDGNTLLGQVQANTGTVLLNFSLTPL